MGLNEGNYKEAFGYALWLGGNEGNYKSKGTKAFGLGVKSETRDHHSLQEVSSLWWGIWCQMPLRMLLQTNCAVVFI
ncbi:hypothetical protein BBW65_01725 [Helicobacter enhydrae]|uniref:Uncharacterized protein n=1 Tax=Helicobacter enhydrae TaxID=222136 RepID=A0A1B1U4B9_9HELI|nr:hypothetical protein BBW65_01725 [Helicobacter enhydrae]